MLRNRDQTPRGPPRGFRLNHLDTLPSATFSAAGALGATSLCLRSERRHGGSFYKEKEEQKEGFTMRKSEKARGKLSEADEVTEMSTVLQSHLSCPSTRAHVCTCAHTHTHTQMHLFSCEMQCPRERNQRKGYLTEPFLLFLKKELMIICSLFLL